MVGVGIIKIYGQSDQAQTEDPAIKIDVRLRITGHCGDVMNSFQ
jgi:hypothetical protein